MTETPTPEQKPEKEVKELETLEEKLDFIRTRFVDETMPTKWTREVAEPGEEVAEIEFGGDLFVGELKQEEAEKIALVTGVDLLKDKPGFSLVGEFEFDVFQVPNTKDNTYLLVRELEGEKEVLFYAEEMLEFFEMSMGLERN